ncbi:MAG: DNA polymerase III subunit delta [Candidatus Hydrogenedens sp.]|nr:DNA polymerase III subunit delta [Candidatus Hydrogenedens sp.]
MRKIGSEPLPPVLVFAPGKAAFGKEPFEPALAEEAIAAIMAEYVDPSMRDLAYSAYNASDTAPAEIVAEANTLPFLVERRVMLVRGADRYFDMASDKKSPIAPLLDYLASPNPATLLMFVAPGPDKRKKLYKAMAEADALVECPQLDDRALSAWIRHKAELQGKSIERGAVDELIGRAGSRLSDVGNALALVINFVGEGTAIKASDVHTACADVAEETVWALTDAIAQSDSKKAIEVLHQLLALGKAPDELLGTINWLLENAYRACPESRAGGVKSKFVENKVAPLSRKLGRAKMIEVLALCTRTHFMIRSTGVDHVLALEVLVMRLAAPMPRRAA